MSLWDSHSCKATIVLRGHAESAHLTVAGWSDIDLSRLSVTSIDRDEDVHGSVIEQVPTAGYGRAARSKRKGS